MGKEPRPNRGTGGGRGRARYEKARLYGATRTRRPRQRPQNGPPTERMAYFCKAKEISSDTHQIYFRHSGHHQWASRPGPYPARRGEVRGCLRRVGRYAAGPAASSSSLAAMPAFRAKW
ncbi:MAG: hypothetical protein WKG07_11250 [Hymenobacter sp.]